MRAGEARPERGARRDGWMVGWSFFCCVKEPLRAARQIVGDEAQIKAQLPHDGEGGKWVARWEKKEAKLAARGGRRRWSGLRDTEEVGERDEKSRCRVDLEMNNERGMDEISGVRSTSR